MSESDYRNLHRHLNAGGTLWSAQNTPERQEPSASARQEANRRRAQNVSNRKRLSSQLSAYETELEQATLRKQNLERECDNLQHRLQQKRNALSETAAKIQTLETQVHNMRAQTAQIAPNTGTLAENFRTLAKPITADFLPSEETLEYLIQFKQIALDYIQGKLPEFRLYWLERGDARPNWQSVFRQRMEYLWQREALRTPVPEDFAPSPASLAELMQHESIPVDYAMQVTGAFISYFTELKYQTIAWQALFKQYVRQQWSAQRHETQQKDRRSALEELTDTSWSETLRFNAEGDQTTQHD